MGRSMYQYGKQTKEMDRQRKQIAKNLQRTLVKQQETDSHKNAAPEGAVREERKNDE